MKSLKVMLLVFVIGILCACEGSPPQQPTIPNSLGKVKVESSGVWRTPVPFSDVMVTVFKEEESGKRFMYIQTANKDVFTVVPLSDPIVNEIR